jgi:hypothetical protein
MFGPHDSSNTYSSFICIAVGSTDGRSRRSTWNRSDLAGVTSRAAGGSRDWKHLQHDGCWNGKRASTLAVCCSGSTSPRGAISTPFPSGSIISSGSCMLMSEPSAWHPAQPLRRRWNPPSPRRGGTPRARCAMRFSTRTPPSLTSAARAPRSARSNTPSFSGTRSSEAGPRTVGPPGRCPPSTGLRTGLGRCARRRADADRAGGVHVRGGSAGARRAQT